MRAEHERFRVSALGSGVSMELLMSGNAAMPANHSLAILGRARPSLNRKRVANRDPAVLQTSSSIKQRFREGVLVVESLLIRALHGVVVGSLRHHAATRSQTSGARVMMAVSGEPR